jgi:rubrerythrin
MKGAVFMAVETIHKEREMLFRLLRLSKELRQNKEIREITTSLIATMEADDVEYVKSKLWIWNQSKPRN